MGLSAERHGIVERERAFEADPARFDHFTLGPGTPIDESSLLADPSWTLYALDPDRDRALLVRLPRHVDLADAPFVYMAQFEQAQEAASVPIDRLLAMAEDLPRPARFVHLFSTGRCGSTLASRIFARLDGVRSVSEPDAVAQLVGRRHEFGTPGMRAMLRAVALWSYRPPTNPSTPTTDETCVVKYRSEALFAANDHLCATPGSAAMFLYRDLVGWVDSAYRFGQKQGVDMSAGSDDVLDVVWPILSAGAPLDAAVDIFDAVDPALPAEDVLAALWALRIEARLAAGAAGATFLDVSYEQLNADRAATVTSMLRLLGRDDGENHHRAMQAYDRDSQEGTAGARSRPAHRLRDDQRSRLAGLMSSNDRIRAAVDAMD